MGLVLRTTNPSINKAAVYSIDFIVFGDKTGGRITRNHNKNWRIYNINVVGLGTFIISEALNI